MSKLNVATKIAIVTSSILLGTALCGTKIVTLPDNFQMITQGLHQSSQQIIQGDNQGVDTEYFKSDFTKTADVLENGKKLVEDLEAEGAVLLKNDNNALPLAKKSKISLVGYQSFRPAEGGRGSASAEGSKNAALSLVDTLPNALSADGSPAAFDINQDLIKFYRENPKYKLADTNNESKDATWNDLTAAGQVDNITAYGDAAIYTISRVSGENDDMIPGYLKLHPAERSVLTGLNDLKKAGKIKKIIVLFNTANQLEDILSDTTLGIDAAIWMGHVGTTGAKAVANILAGSVNPSGHLSDTYWYKHSDNPVNKNFGAYVYGYVDGYDLPGSENGNPRPQFTTYDVYQEGVYLGYRYAETRYSDVVTKREGAGNFDYSKVISHPFGYGQSYTNFEFSNYKVAENGNYYNISIDVKNIGDKYSGKDVVQIYVQKPYNQETIDREIEVPAVELIGFAKTKVLAPGETETLEIVVDQREFAVYDAKEAKSYFLNNGDYYLAAGSDAHDAMNNILASQGYGTKDGMTAEGNSKLAKKLPINVADQDRYSISKATGNKITNLFDEADINKYDGVDNKVTYLSRNNWVGTFPESNVKLNMTDKIFNDYMAQESAVYEEDDIAYPVFSKTSGKKPIQLISLRVDSEGKPLSYNDSLWDTFLNQLSWEETTALVTSGARSTPGLDVITKPDTMDHNGPTGLTQPYGSTKNSLTRRFDPDGASLHPALYQSVGIIAATFSKDLFIRFGNALGEDALWVGYAGFYGVGVNTHRSPYQGRSFEYMSEDPFLAGTLATYESQGLEAHGCHAYLKHFALNEQESQRQGVGIWANEQALREIYLRPFEKAIVDGGAFNAMASFTRIGTKYNPGSKALLTDFARGECGLRGLIVTDMYKQAYQAEQMAGFIMAGCDLPDGSAFIQDELKTNHGAFANAMRESAKRVLYSTVTSNAMNTLDSNTKIIAITPAWAKTVYSVDIVLGVLWVGFLATGITLAVLDFKKRAHK